MIVERPERGVFALVRLLSGLLLVAIVLHTTVARADHEPWVQIEYPQDKEKLWWDDDWWERGELDRPESFDVVVEQIEYPSTDTEVPAFVYRPTRPGEYLPVLFQHGRRGLDDLTRLLPLRLAARGFIVLAPDVWSARFIEKYPMGHDYAVEEDVANGIDVLLGLSGVKGDKACVVSHTRGGYMTLKALVVYKKQGQQVACYVSSYPHWQDPNEPEPMQAYRYASELNHLTVPVLVFLGEHDQYQRVRPIVEGIELLREKGRKPQLIVYPGVGRGFDFRPSHVRTLADDLAAKDAIRRTEIFIRTHLE